MCELRIAMCELRIVDDKKLAELQELQDRTPVKATQVVDLQELKERAPYSQDITASLPDWLIRAFRPRYIALLSGIWPAGKLNNTG